MTVRSLPSKRTFAPLEVGCRPSPASITPDLTSSSLYFVISPRPSVLGITPASDSGLPGTRTMKRIGVSFVVVGVVTTRTSNEVGRNRRRPGNFPWLTSLRDHHVGRH